MPTPESIVLSKCKDMLKRLEICGWIRHWDRISVGLHMNMQGYMQQHGKKGSPDLLAFIPVDNLMWIMFFEVKRSEGGIQSVAQKEFENKFIGFSNAIYAIITDAKQIKDIIKEARLNSVTINDLGDLPEDIG